MDANYQTVATVGAGNGYEADLHDFQIAPDNVAYLTVYNLMRCDLSAVGGVRNGTLVDTAVQEVDMKTGLVRWEWHSARPRRHERVARARPDRRDPLGRVPPELDRPRSPTATC